MASRRHELALPAWWAATALSALLWWFGSGVQPLWWMAWLAPMPVLWLSPRVRARWAALSAFTAYAAGSFNVLGYLHAYIGMPLPVVVLVIFQYGFMLALSVLLFRRLLLRGHALAAAFAPPALWVAIEYIGNLLSPHATFFNIGYTQMNALPIIQIAAITGIWGLGFLLLLLPATIALQLAPQAAKRERAMAAATTSLLIIGAVAYGGWRLQSPATGTIRIGLASLQNPTRSDSGGPGDQALAARYSDAFGRLAQAGAKIVLIPETSFTTSEPTIPAFARLAKQRDLIIGTGVDFRGDASARRNTLMVFQPDAESPAIYSKHHLLIGLEEYTPGNSFTMLGGSPRIGLAICKDMDFHDVSNAYAARNAQLLLVPASDFVVDGWLHSRMAIMRGVESGFAVARAARDGRLTLSDDRGRVVAERSSEHGEAELAGDLPLHETHTPYARWGDWFAWIDLALLVALLMLAFRRRTASA